VIPARIARSEPRNGWALYIEKAGCPSALPSSFGQKIRGPTPKDWPKTEIRGVLATQSLISAIREQDFIDAA
jgi:hypothetical protein